MLRFEGDVFLLGTAILAPVPIAKDYDAQATAPFVETAGSAAGHGGRMLARSAAAYSGFGQCCKRRLTMQGELGQETGPMTMLPITLTMAGAAALINLWLGVRVSLLRRRHKISIGHGGNSALATRMRAHANFIEYTPFFLVLLGLIEAARGSQSWLWGAAIAYILARLAHPIGMDRAGAAPLRAGGIVVTWAVLLGLAAYAIAIPYGDRTAPAISYVAGTASGSGDG